MDPYPVKPFNITNYFGEDPKVMYQKNLENEIQDAEAKKDSVINQLHMFEEKRDLEILPVRFVLDFTCDDLDCSGHKLSILDWEFGQLYRKSRNTKDCKEKMQNKAMKII